MDIPTAAAAEQQMRERQQQLHRLQNDPSAMKDFVALHLPYAMAAICRLLIALIAGSGTPAQELKETCLAEVRRLIPSKEPCIFISSAEEPDKVMLGLRADVCPPHHNLSSQLAKIPPGLDEKGRKSVMKVLEYLFNNVRFVYAIVFKQLKPALAALFSSGRLEEMSQLECDRQNSTMFLNTRAVASLPYIGLFIETPEEMAAVAAEIAATTTEEDDASSPADDASSPADAGVAELASED